MQADRFTIKAQEALAAAARLAEERRHSQVTPEHLLTLMLEGRFGEGDTVRVDAADGELVFERVESAAPVAA